MPDMTVLFGSTTTAAATTATPVGANTAATGLAATTAAGDAAARNALGHSCAAAASGATCGYPATRRRFKKISSHAIVPRRILNLQNENEWSR